MNKKVMKIMSAAMLVIMLVLIVSPVFATAAGIAGGVTADYSNSYSGKITGIGKKILSVLTILGIVISVIVIAGLGIKYITGSAEEKAEYKKSFVPLLVGMVLLLGASSIAQFLINTVA